MNETLKSILERRSIRKYKRDAIPENILTSILEAGQFAATGRGKQPWHFTVVRDTLLLDDISKTCQHALLQSKDPFHQKLGMMPDFHTFYHAPVAIILSADENEIYGPIDCANATQNMAVAAHSLGIGSCYILSFLQAFSGEKRASFMERLKLPKGHVPLIALSLGYADGNHPEAASRKENTITFID